MKSADERRKIYNGQVIVGDFREGLVPTIVD